MRNLNCCCECGPVQRRELEIEFPEMSQGVQDFRARQFAPGEQCIGDLEGQKLRRPQCALASFVSQKEPDGLIHVRFVPLDKPFHCNRCINDIARAQEWQSYLFSLRRRYRQSRTIRSAGQSPNLWAMRRIPSMARRWRSTLACSSESRSWSVAAVRTAKRMNSLREVLRR